MVPPGETPDSVRTRERVEAALERAHALARSWSAQDPALAIEKPLTDGETALLLLNRETDTQNVTVLFDEL